MPSPAGAGWCDNERVRIRGRAKIAGFSVVGALVVVALAGQERTQVGPFETTLSVRPSLTGSTTVLLPPLGSIHLDTHDAPIAVDLRVDELQLVAAERIASDPASVDQLGRAVEDDVRRALRWLIVRCLIAAIVGGAVGALLAHTTMRSALLGGLAGLVLVGGVSAVAAATFDRAAIAEPRYSGILTVAPQAVGDVETIIERVDEYRSQLSELVENVVVLYRAAESVPVAPAGDVTRILHVSDIHLNPQAFDLIEQLVRRFGVDAVADTGDTTDWGSDPESTIIDRIGALDVPYVWVRGNHDSRATQAAVAAQPNAVVLDGDAADVAGLRFWGIGDPRYTPNKDQALRGQGERDAAEAFAGQVRRELGRDRPPAVDVAMVHDRRMARTLGGQVPLVLAGHVHRTAVNRLGERTLVLTEGSTGGAGLRGLQGAEPKPLQCSILYFDKKTGELIAYDRVTVRALGETGVTISRHVLEHGSEITDRSSTSTSAGTTPPPQPGVVSEP